MTAHDVSPRLAGTCTVVIVSYYTGPVLLDCLTAALEQDGVDLVVLVDNGNDPSIRTQIDTVAARQDRLRIVSGHGNIGFARGCNLGAREARGDAILLLNPDCIMRPGVVRHGLQVLLENPTAAALTVRVENVDGTEQRGARRNLMTPWTCLVEQFRLDRLVPNHPQARRVNLHQTPAIDEVTPVPCISGAFMMIPRHIYEELGGMDEDYFLHVEDVDFCFRIHQSGRQILYAPRFSVTHSKGTSRAVPLVVEWHKSVSAIRYFYKHFRVQYPALLLHMISIAVLLRFLGRGMALTALWVWRRNP
jgi:GT2 family glycosyltransferase